MPLVIPYVDQTWADGSGGGTPVSAARLNVVEAGVKAAHYMPAVRVTHNAAQAIVTATLTALAFNTERFDTASNAADTQHDTATLNSRLTCRYAGKYQISASVEWAGSSSGTFRDVRIRLNGATYLCIDRRAPLGTATTQHAISTLYDLAVNDYVECVVQHDVGANLNLNSSGNYSPELMMVRVA